MFEADQTNLINSYTKHLEFANGSGSDLFAMLNAYKTWRHLKSKRFFGDARMKNAREQICKAEQKWANQNHLKLASLYECDDYVSDLRVRLNCLNFKQNKTTWSPQEEYIVLKVVISGAFYPHYFSLSTKNQREYNSTAYKMLNGLDPTNTIYFQDCPPDFLPHIYMEKIKEIFSGCGIVDVRDLHKITVTHDGVSRKLFVTFNKNGKEDDVKKYGVACQPGFVLTEIYKSVKLRQMKGLHTIHILK